MATFARHVFCFLFIALYACSQTESRQSKFLSEFFSPKKNVLLSSPTPAPQPITSHISYVPATAPVGANYDSSPAPAPAPETVGANYAPAPASETVGDNYGPAPASETVGTNYGPAPVLAPTMSGNGYVEDESNWYYGLYARGTIDSPQEDAEFSNEFSVENPVLSNNNNFPSEQENVYDEDREQNGYLNHLSDENGFWNSNHKGYRSGEKYYNVDRNNYSPTGLELARENNSEEQYYNGYYDKSKYEFDSMEEYEKQEGYADVQQEFIP